MRGHLRGHLRGARLPRNTGGFTPLQLPDLILWLDPADASTVTLNGSDVSAIADKSANGNDFSQGTAALQPAYDTVGINGHNTIDWESTNTEYMESDAAVTHSIGTGDFYFASLVNPESIGSIAGLLGDGATDTIQLFMVRNFPATQRVPTVLLASPQVFDSQLPTAGVSHTLDYWRTGTSVRCELNGTLDTDSRTDSGNAGTSATMRLGDTSFTEHYDGRMGDIILTSSLPTAAQRTASRDFRNNKWGL